MLIHVAPSYLALVSNYNKKERYNKKLNLHQGSKQGACFEDLGSIEKRLKMSDLEGEGKAAKKWVEI